MLPGDAGAQAAAAAGTTTDITFSGQTEKHRDVAEFMTRLGLLPQLMGITLSSSVDTAAGASSTTTATYKQFTVTAKLRPYTTTPPTTTLQPVTP